MIKKIFIIFLTLAFISYGKEIKLKSIHIENLPDTYKEVFREFFFKNFHIKEETSSKNKLKVNISWTGLSYTVCFHFLFFDKKERISCFTAQTGEEFYEKFFDILEEYKKTEPKTKTVDLTIKSENNPEKNKIKISSEKRDVLVGYKSTKHLKNSKKKPLVEGVINIDTLYLKDKEAAKLLKFLLKGNKIRQILIIK
ncbi:MAG: hypothetical protein GXO21_08505 [Aquificae bacterium]|nr:hypothetical protein [Aquificota bacterium]